MPKLLINFAGDEFTCGMAKVDRSKLYGYRTTEVFDENDQPCELATLADDGKTVIPLGGTAFAYIAQNGEWRDKPDLRPVNLEGEEIKPVPSTFKAPVIPEETTIDDFLWHGIRLVYALEAEAGFPEAFVSDLDAGKVFKFQFSYRGGMDPDSAFLLKGQDIIWMAVGKPSGIRFTGLEQAGTAAGSVEAGEVSVDDGLMDFEMM